MFRKIFKNIQKTSYFILPISQFSWKILFNTRYKLYARILFVSLVHKPWKLLVWTLSPFHCSLSCKNTVSTLLHNWKINRRIGLGDQSILLLERFRARRQIPCLAISSAKDSPTYSLSLKITRSTWFWTIFRRTFLSSMESQSYFKCGNISF